VAVAAVGPGGGQAEAVEGEGHCVLDHIWQAEIDGAWVTPYLPVQRSYI